jgi:hypothetical protein
MRIKIRDYITLKFTGEKEETTLKRINQRIGSYKLSRYNSRHLARMFDVQGASPLNSTTTTT